MTNTLVLEVSKDLMNKSVKKEKKAKCGFQITKLSIKISIYYQEIRMTYQAVVKNSDGF